MPNGTGTGAGNSSIGGYGDNQAAPITLFQFAPAGTSNATFVNSLVLPQAASGANLPVSGEYGSSSEGTIQLSGNGQYLTLLGYGIDVASFNANPGAYGSAPSFALAQSGALTGQPYTPVPRVLTLVDAFANVNSSTALYNIFDTNNPRSGFTATGATAYVSGQGSGSDATGGVFYTAIGARNTAPTHITGLDTTSNTLSQDTRDVQIVNNTLYVSVDTKGGKNSAPLLHRYARHCWNAAHNHRRRPRHAHRLRKHRRHRQVHHHHRRKWQRQRVEQRRPNQPQPRKLLLRQRLHPLCRRQR